jgi:hypothetical protein
VLDGRSALGYEVIKILFHQHQDVNVTLIRHILYLETVDYLGKIICDEAVSGGSRGE